jgi:hypothetical protein
MKADVIISALLMGIVTAASSAAEEPQKNAPSQRGGDKSYRSITAIQIDLRAALRAEASSRRLGPNTSEVIRLIDLYREMAAHPKRDTSLVLKQLGSRLRSRLDKVSDHIEREVSRANRDAEKVAHPALQAPGSMVLAQQLPVPGGAAPGLGGQPGGAGAAGIVDYGPDLVDVIQRTISPGTWDINGGNGAIVYFSPLRVLVVSAPGTVHDQIGDVLGQLRAAP